MNLGFFVFILKYNGGRASSNLTWSRFGSVGWQNTSLSWLSFTHSVVPLGSFFGRPGKPVFTMKGSFSCSCFRFKECSSSDPGFETDSYSGNLNTRLLLLSLVFKVQLDLLCGLKLSGQLFGFKAVSSGVRFKAVSLGVTVITSVVVIVIVTMTALTTLFVVLV